VECSDLDPTQRIHCKIPGQIIDVHGIVGIPLGKLIPYYFEGFYRMGEGFSISFGEYFKHGPLVEDEADLVVFIRSDHFKLDKLGF